MFAARAIFVALFALGQLIPSGFALAADGAGGVDLVICTADGPKTVSWEEFTGEKSPFETPAEHEGRDCPACHTTCRAGLAVAPDLERLSHPWSGDYPAALPEAAGASVVFATRPPMPSRAPPSSSI
jgi:hypothetical protein